MGSGIRILCLCQLHLLGGYASIWRLLLRFVNELVNAAAGEFAWHTPPWTKQDQSQNAKVKVMHCPKNPKESSAEFLRTSTVRLSILFVN